MLTSRADMRSTKSKWFHLVGGQFQASGAVSDTMLVLSFFLTETRPLGGGGVKRLCCSLNDGAGNS